VAVERDFRDVADFAQPHDAAGVCFFEIRHFSNMSYSTCLKYPLFWLELHALLGLRY
jgi:hypothetical protein